MSFNPTMVAIVGGCGHVGLPLGLVFAQKGMQVQLVDINQDSVARVNRGELPFLEENGEALLKEVVGNTLRATTNASVVKEADVVVFVTGTPVDEHHNPRVQDVLKVIDAYEQFLSPHQLIVLRSTVYPGVMDLVHQRLTRKMGSCLLAFCPERIVQGKALEEIWHLPQIVSATSEKAEQMATDLFSKITKKVIPLACKEAELAKLITNSWRYVEFAIANQFYMMVESAGLDFFKIFRALKEEYPRAQHYARPGLAAGPCLFKDTMQLSAFHNNQFFLGQSSMLINEGLPNFLVQQLEQKIGSLQDKKIAILGMTFKPNNDDIRESLSFKLRKILEMRLAQVLPCDPYISGTTDLKVALSEADAVVLGVPHREYVSLKIEQPFVDCWGVWR